MTTSPHITHGTQMSTLVDEMSASGRNASEMTTSGDVDKEAQAEREVCEEDGPLLTAAREAIAGSTPPRECADDYRVPAALWLTLQAEVMERLRANARIAFGVASMIAAHGKTPCDDCAGTGTYSDGLPCDGCKGSGVNAQEAPSYWCNKCGYRGPEQISHQRPNGTGECGYIARLIEELK